MEKKKELEDLLVSVSENDDYAFRVFYDLYYRSVFRFAYYFLRNREACGEVVSNVFVAVWSPASRCGGSKTSTPTSTSSRATRRTGI